MRRALAFLPVLLIAWACAKDDPIEENPSHTSYPDKTREYANLFAFNMMNSFYLWKDYMEEDIRRWTDEEDPVQKVADLRYKDSSGRLIDKWTRLMEDYRPFAGSITGNTESFGFDFVLYYADEAHRRVYAVVTYVYAGSPAAKTESLRRGSVITSLDGVKMTPDNYQELIQSKLYSGGTVTLEMLDGSSISLSASQIYENPVHTVRSFSIGGHLIGYLHYTGFTPRSAIDLIPVFQSFGEEGIEELVLDLRYNGGGYMSTCTCLASLIAPKSILDKEVFIKEVYNSNFDDEETLFQLSPVVSEGETSYTLDLADAKASLNLNRVWVITTGATASAAETLICGLKPYMDLHTVGEKSYGKFCGGYLITATSFFTTLAEQGSRDINTLEALSATENWGIYVISSRYSDRNSVTLSMPDGIPAEYEAFDNPLDGHELGDPAETMLAATLSLITGEGTKATPAAAPETLPSHRPGFGVLLH